MTSKLLSNAWRSIQIPPFYIVFLYEDSKTAVSRIGCMSNCSLSGRCDGMNPPDGYRRHPPLGKGDFGWCSAKKPPLPKGGWQSARTDGGIQPERWQPARTDGDFFTNIFIVSDY